MSTDVRCSDPEALASYLYDECDPAERLAIAGHLASCARCADEVAGLTATRARLATWVPPDARLGFRIAEEGDLKSQVPNPKSQVADRKSRIAGGRHWWPWAGVPAWAQLAAAVVLLASGAALANLDVAYGNGGVTLRFGRPVPAAMSANATPAGTVSPGDLAALEQRLREAIARGGGPRADTVRAPQPGEADVLPRVRDLIAASEERQQRELSLRLTQALRDMDMQRRSDITRLERAVVEVEGSTGAEVLQQRQMIDYLMKVSQQR